jgi:hypothetical protein
MTTDPKARERWEHVAAELRAHREAQREAWGDLDNATLGRYLVGEVTAEERERVEAAMKQHPELGVLIQLVAEVLGEVEPAQETVAIQKPALAESPSMSSASASSTRAKVPSAPV